MTTQSGFPRRYEAIYHDDDRTERAGALSMSADGMLTVLGAEDRYARTLDLAVRNMNDMKNESVRVPPGPGDSRYALKSRVIPRDSPEFIPTMLADLRRTYRLELKPAEQ